MNSLLKEKLNSMVSSSKVFKLMSEADQSALLASFETASDDQLAQSIAVLEARERQFNESEQVRLQRAQDQIAAAEALHNEIKISEKIEMAAEEMEDQASSLKQLAEIEKQIGITPPAQDKPKKFLGLF